MPSSSFFRNLPGEVRNQLYELTALPNSAEPIARVLKTVTEDGTIALLDTVRPFFIDTVSESGRSTLFGIDLVHVTELTQEVLTLVMPQILFTFNTPHSLDVFAETFNAHVGVCNVVPELHIELNFTEGLSEEDLRKIGSWAECMVPHGREINMHDRVEEWMKAIEPLPQITTIHLVFSHIWRDFRELRGLAMKLGLSRRPVTFQFPTPVI
jgi:hypothetical protein